MLLLLACTPPDKPPADTVDTGPAPADDTGTADTDDTTDTAGPCDTDPSDDRPTSFAALIARLEAQGCLADADEDAMVAYIQPFFTYETVWCDAVYRIASTDGLFFSGTPELVREHASVPDVRIEGDTHVVVYNDLTPGLFEQTLREDPARFWRQGLVGIGGLGVSRNAGAGFVEGTLDLALPELRLVIDPDLGGVDEARLVSFQIKADTLDGTTWDPAQTPSPHSFYRAVAPTSEVFPAPTLVVASSTGDNGGFDPTVLDIPEGEILFAGDFTAPLLGWTAPGGVYPEVGTLPDVVTSVRTGAPDAIVDPDGGYRIYAFDPDSGRIFLAESEDGRAWLPSGPATDPALGQMSNPSVARDAAGTWWMYYSQRERTCMEAFEEP